MTAYFSKELPDQPVYLSSGKPFKFEVLETGDDWIIDELRSAQRNGVGGVIEIDKARYEELKKNLNNRPSPDSFPRRAELSPQFSSFQPANRVAGNREMPDPIEITEPKQFVRLKPKIAKIE